MPTISPGCTCNEMSWNSPARLSPVTVSSGSPVGWKSRRGGNTYSIVRPVIRFTNSRVGVVVAGRFTADVRPSRSTVTWSPISRISSNRWEM
jgi:hypothetical protein